MRGSCSIDMLKRVHREEFDVDLGIVIGFLKTSTGGFGGLEEWIGDKTVLFLLSLAIVSLLGPAIFSLLGPAIFSLLGPAILTVFGSATSLELFWWT